MRSTASRIATVASDDDLQDCCFLVAVDDGSETTDYF